MDDQLSQAALDYHRYPTPGKIAVTPTKGMSNQRDLALAYSPGVAVPCLEIKKDPLLAYDYTAKGNLVAVISNGTAVLGLGNIGAVAGKPVMEGKGCLFKKFAGIDVFDIEIDETDPDKLVETIASLEPTFGGINLEDIKAPECFLIETRLRERMKIPVFHDDQHGTAIVAAAALLNALEVVGKQIEDVKLVCSGAGAAAIACLNIVVGLGVRRENIWVTDSKGVVYRGRTASMDPQKERYAQDTRSRTLAEIVPGADVFFGLSMAGVLKPEMVAQMADRPIILAMANPDPEIRPELAKAGPARLHHRHRPLGLSEPGQQRPVLPVHLPRALDVGATTINEEMKLACVRAIAELARADVSDVVAAAYGRQDIRFGPEYLIPPPFDPRLITTWPRPWRRPRWRSGVATRPLADLRAYRASLQRFVYTSGTVMQPVFQAASDQPTKRIVYAEGEDDRVLRAAQVAVDEKLARPVLVGRPEVIQGKVRDLGLRLTAGRDYEVVGFDDREFLDQATAAYYRLGRRRGLTRDYAAAEMRRNGTLIGAMLVREGRADGMLCGTFGPYASHLKYVAEAIGVREGVRELRRHASADAAAADRLRLRHLHQPRPDGRAARRHRPARGRGGAPVRPRAAPRLPVAFQLRLGRHARRRARCARARPGPRAGARSSRPRARCTPTPRSASVCSTRCSPNSGLTAEANLLVMPNLDAANITFNALKIVAGQGVTVGPILLGAAKPVHILTPPVPSAAWST